VVVNGRKGVDYVNSAIFWESESSQAGATNVPKRLLILRLYIMKIAPKGIKFKRNS